MNCISSGLSAGSDVPLSDQSLIGISADFFSLGPPVLALLIG